jgi:hypothetical protein
MSLAYIDRIVYDALGYTGSIYYCRFVRKRDGWIWDPIAGVMATAPTWADSAVAMPEIGWHTGQYAVPITAAHPREVFDVIVHKQAGSFPVNTDDVVLQYDTAVGSIFGF